MAKWALPTSLPGGELLPHMSARMRQQTMDALYEGIGGFEAHKAHIEKNDEHRAQFYKDWAKGVPRVGNVEVTASEGIESMLKKLDERDRAREANTIDSTCVTVVEQPSDSN